MADLGVGRDRNQHEQVLVPLGGHARVGRRRLADINGRGFGDARSFAEDVTEILFPVRGEEQGVMWQLRHLTFHTEEGEHRTGPG